MSKFTVFLSAVNKDCGAERDLLMRTLGPSDGYVFLSQPDLGEGGKTLENIYSTINDSDMVLMILDGSAGTECVRPEFESLLRQLRIASRGGIDEDYTPDLTYTLWEGVIAVACRKPLEVCLGPNAEKDPKIARFIKWLYDKWGIYPVKYADRESDLEAKFKMILQRANRRRYEGATGHLFPSRYDSFRVARQEFVAFATERLKKHKRLVLYGQAGLGKTTMASEISVAMVEDKETYFSLSISWVDILAPTREQTRENLLLALQREVRHDSVPSRPGKEKFLALDSFDKLNRDTAQVLAECTVAVNDLESGMSSAGVRKLSSDVLQQLFDLQLVTEDQRTRPPYIILTSRPGMITLGDDTYVLQDIRATSLASCQDRRLPHFAVALPLLSPEESVNLVQTCLISLQEEFGYFWGDHLSVLETLEASVSSDAFTPLELLLLCELTARAIRRPNYPRLLAKWTSILRPTEALSAENVISHCFHSWFPITGLYEELWDQIQIKNAPLADSLEKALAIFSLGLNRTSMNLQLERYSDAARLLLAHPDDRARMIGSQEDEEYVYELAHPTVVHLTALRHIVPKPEVLQILCDTKTSNPYLDRERHMFRMFCSETSDEPLPHEYVEMEPRGVCFLLGAKLGISAELAAYFITPAEAEDPHRELLEELISRKVHGACDLDPSLVMAACRLSETLYQQLDEWRLRDVLIDSLWAHERFRPTCVRGSALEERWSMVGWYTNVADLEAPHSLGREYLRQAEMVKWLENATDASNFPSLDLSGFDALMEEYCAQKAGTPCFDIIAAFANYLFLLSCAGEIALDLDIKLDAGRLSAKWFKRIDLEADVLRANLNSILPNALTPGEKPVEPFSMDANADSRQERIYEHVLRAYEALSLAFGLPSHEARDKIVIARSRIRLAVEAFEEWPGDEWIGYQIQMLKAGVDLAHMPQAAASDMESWEQLVKASFEFFEQREIHYCSALLLWNDLVKRIASEASMQGQTVEEILKMEPLKSAFFRFLQNQGAERYAYLPEELLPLLPDEKDALASLEGVPVGMYTIAAAIERYGHHVLPESEYNALVETPTRVKSGQTLRGLLKMPLSTGKTPYVIWSEAIYRLIPGLTCLPAGNLPVPPFVTVEALLYRSVPKGVTKWCER